MKSSEIVDKIFTVHQVKLGKDLTGIIFCGSIATSDSPTGSDVDYVVIVSAMDSEIVKAVTEVRSELDAQLAFEVSNTLVAIDEVMHLASVYRHVDGKAVQAIIESDTNKIRMNTSRLQIPQLSQAELFEFSRYNYFTLRMLLVKMLVRAGSPLGVVEKKKMAKVALIMIKMLRQMNFTNSNLDDSRNVLLDLKTGDSSYDDVQVRSVLLEVCAMLDFDE